MMAMRSRLALLGALVAFPACGAERPADVAAPVLSSQASAAASEQPRPPPPAPPPSPSAQRPAPAASDASPPLAAVTPDSWLATHGVPPLEGMISCDAILTVGAPPREAIRCTRMSAPRGDESGRTLFTAVIYVVEANKLRPIFQAPEAAGPLDPEGCPDEACFYVKLDLALSPDGKTIVLSERPGLGCREADAKRKELRSEGFSAASLAEQAKLTAVVCAARGTYRYSGRSFVRSAGSPAGAGGSTPGPSNRTSF
jgi:hypothetical protein